MNTQPDGFERELGPGGLEHRSIPAMGLEARQTDENRPQIVGFGSVYGQTTTIHGFFSEWDEEVAKGAWAKTITEDGADIRSMFNHDTNWLLGRTTSDTLRLEDRDEGLWYEVDINPDDVNAMSVHAKVERGDVTGSSVWFRVIRQEWTEPDDSNDLERPLRTILEARLFETGPVVFPAFPQTSAGTRSLDGVLRAAGVTNPTRRAELASDLLADPDGVEARITELFARRPDLRDSVCQTAADTPSGADPSAPADGPPARSSRPHLTIARKRLELTRYSP